ncbi:MAG: rRNA adenine dimethyltransferase family protein, partial [Ghiorsea sp.]|nr:rRNA adenine dimethyltransferase family protein [Ghiorsea sp.]
MKKETKNILKEYGIRPRKRLGQNFLISKHSLEKLVKASDLQKDDIVLEIGPGTGTLTKELAQRARKIIAVEKDKRMINALKKMLERWNIRNVEIVEGDILKIKNLEFNKNLELKIKNYKVVANLPNYIAAPFIRIFLESSNPPKVMILMVQKEAGERICASSPKMSKLAVFCQFFGKPEII